MVEDIWQKTNVEQYEGWIGSTDHIAVTVIPALGAKAVSLVNRKTGREWLWRSGKPFGNRGFGSSFADGDESGWDEMFPCINACNYPDAPWQGCAIPDHGEVWSLPWESRRTGSQLRCRVNGVRFPYTLEKVYSFASDHTLRIDYTLKNRSDFPFSFLWAAHPLFRVREGMRLHVPEELTEIEISHSERRRLGAPLDRQCWPIAQTRCGRIDLSVIGPADGRHAEKYYFVGKLKQGWARLSDPASGEAVAFRFPADKVPYLAIWANYGGYGGFYHVAIEPATATMDDIGLAVRRGEAATVEARGEYAWHLEVALE
jgi:hypothetical protein